MTQSMPLLHSPALFMTSLIKLLGGKRQHSPSCFRHIQTCILNEQDQNQTEIVLCLFVISLVSTGPIVPLPVSSTLTELPSRSSVALTSCHRVSSATKDPMKAMFIMAAERNTKSHVTSGPRQPSKSSNRARREKIMSAALQGTKEENVAETFI